MTRYFLAALVAVLVGWFLFFRKTGTVAMSGLAMSLDPYANLRANVGGWSPEKWSGSDPKFNSKGYWIILRQDFPGQDTVALNNALQAFLIGYDIHPSTWQFRSGLEEDFGEYVEQNLGIIPEMVSVGQYTV